SGFCAWADVENKLKDISSGYMLSRDEAYAKTFNAKRPELDDLISKIGSTVSTQEERQRRSKLILSVNNFMETFDRVHFVVSESAMKEADIKSNIDMVYAESQETRDAVFALIDQFYEQFSKEQEQALTSSQSHMDSTVLIMLIAPLVTLLFAALVAFLLIRSFLTPMRQLEQAVSRIVEGDLRHRIHSSATDELGRLSRNFDAMAERVSEMIHGARRIAESLTGHSYQFKLYSQETAAVSVEMLQEIEEIAAAADKQAGRADQGAQLISLLREEVSGIHQSAEAMRSSNADADQHLQAGYATVEALKVASQQSETLIKQAVDAMKELADSSKQIGKITSVITEISNQTHLLAFNAAIESARAGVHGKGFSVIAEEVRKLSLESNRSAKQIAEMVGITQGRTEEAERGLLLVRNGLALQKTRVDETMGAFSSIGESMGTISLKIVEVHQRIVEVDQDSNHLTAVVHETAAAAQETAAGAEEVNAGTVQQNLSILRIATESDEIHILAQSLFEEIGKFTVDVPDHTRADD
ncbi:MAG: methyl-accepting chemotaxis protein, partial [Gorillibacterium sp.]|nr:methyl-accepting chemotaxis protein [Gorillibacterium sp.]